MHDINLLRELSSHLLNLAAICTDNSFNTTDTEDAAWLSGSARGYMMAAKILSVRADALQVKYLADKAEHEHAGQCHLSDLSN